jgi:hypothetical protein
MTRVIRQIYLSTLVTGELFMFRKLALIAAATLACSGAMAASQTFNFDNQGGTLAATGFYGTLGGGELILAGSGLMGSTVTGYTYFSNVLLDGSASGITQTGSFNFGGTTYGTSYSFSLNSAATSHTLTYDLAQAGTSTATPSVTGSFTSQQVAAVPEPETYAMMLAGLGALGFLGRRRKAA